jgi:hypothetical protein
LLHTVKFRSVIASPAKIQRINECRALRMVKLMVVYDICHLYIKRTPA